jgi:hypothetical protein
MKTFKELMQEKVQFEIPQHYEEDNNEFIAAASAAHRAGKKEFTLGGKTYPVTIKKPIKEQAPVAPVPDKKYIKGTPEYKAYMATKKTRVGHPTTEEKDEDLPFTPDKPKKNPVAKAGKYGQGYSVAKHLAQMAAKRQAEKQKEVKEGKYVPDDVHIDPKEKFAKEKAASHNAAVEKAKKMAAQRPVKEEVELDELNKSTLASYAKKATHDSRINQKMAKDFEAQSNKSRKPDMKTAADRLAGHYQKKAWKRQDGVNKAIDRLAKESYDETEYDYEGDMARGDLKSIMMNAKRVHDLLKPESNLPEWVQSKITKAEDYISTVANYMATEMMDEETISEDMYSSDEKPGKDGRMKPAHRINFANSGTDKTKAEIRKEKEKEKEMSEQITFTMTVEQFEQLDEISKKTLGSYVSKASVDMANRTADATQKKTLAGADYAHNISRGMDVKTADKHMKSDYDDAKPDVKKAVKRMHGINKAVNRLTKEEVEQVEEKMDLAKAKMGDVIKDFEKSDAPQFAGKSKEKRRQMAIAAKLGAEREAGMKENAEMPSFSDFLKEYEAKDGVYRHKGSYGSSYQGDSDDEDAPKKPSAPAEKRGRGRPVGSKSGARTAGSSTSKKSGVDYSGYPLHLPNKK